MFNPLTASSSKSLVGHQNSVTGVCISPNRQLLFSASIDASVRLWSLHTWSNLVVYRGHAFPVWSVHCGPLGASNYFVSGGADRTARLYIVDQSQPVRIFAGHAADVDAVQMHPNAHYVATGCGDRIVRLFDVRIGQCQRIITGHRVRSCGHTTD